MSKIENSYGASGYYGSQAAQKQQKSKSTKKTETAGKTNKAGQPKLSKKAQELLEKLRKTYSNMDFMVADYDRGEEAKEILSRGTKEFSVLFSTEELEKMASDEKYEKEYMDRVQGAVRMSEQINEQFGFESAGGKTSGESIITKMGIAFNKDGSVDFFAELEKAGEQQKAMMEKSLEKHAEEKKAAAKRTTVTASSMEELVQKIKEVDWNKIKETEKTEGERFDFSV